jgi:hypothetical protein
VEKAEHAALALVDAERERFEQRSLESDPIGCSVHFIFGEFELTRTDVFVGEEFDLLEADDLGADEDVAIRM